MITADTNLQRNELSAFKAWCGIGDIRKLTYNGKDSKQLPAITLTQGITSRKANAKRRCFRRRVSFP
jgi:hypothetical protein